MDFGRKVGYRLGPRKVTQVNHVVRIVVIDSSDLAGVILWQSASPRPFGAFQVAFFVLDILPGKNLHIFVTRSCNQQGEDK